MLETYSLRSFISTTDLDRSKQFYSEILGLVILDENKYIVELDSDGSNLTISLVKIFTPQPFTVLGWVVLEIEEVMESLKESGIEFINFEGIKQNELGICLSENGTKTAWFTDPDGNILSLTE